MAIDFGNPDNRKTYLVEKLDDLLDGINNSYGIVLVDELISRLEKTVNEFNEEVNSLMDQLKENSDRKEQLLEQIKSGKLDETDEEEEVEKPPAEMSEWEKRLEAKTKA